MRLSRAAALGKRTRYFSILNYPATKLTTLGNGIRVATERHEGETATVGVWVDTGSRYETPENNGVAHFLEHMFFKGTLRRTRSQLEEEVENMGGHLNAYTSRELTAFYAKVPEKGVPQAMDILSDILTNSQFSEDAIDRERDVILREMQEIDNTMEEVIFDRLHETAYRGTMLGRTILGPADNIMNNINRAQIVDYVGAHYIGPRIVIVGAGAVDHEALVRLSEKLFGKVSPVGTRPAYMEPAKFTGSDIRVRFDDMPHAHVAFSFATAGYVDPDNFPLMVMQKLLGSWDTSNTAGIHSPSLLVSISAEYHLGKSVSTFSTQYSDTGLFGVYAVADKFGLFEMTHLITKVLTGLCYHVDEDKVAEAKNQLKLNMLQQLDGSSAICEEIGRQLLSYNRRMHPAEIMARIDAVDAKAIKNCANRYFYDRCHALAAVGPIWEMPDYDWLRRRAFWQRY